MVRSVFDSGAILDITNWGFLEKEAEASFSLLSPPDPFPEGKIEFFEGVKIL